MAKKVDTKHESHGEEKEEENESQTSPTALQVERSDTDECECAGFKENAHIELMANPTLQQPGQEEGETDLSEEEEILPLPDKLYKSSRLKGYITLTLASFISYDSAQKSSAVIAAGTVPSSPIQRRYAMAVSILSLILSGAVCLAHLDSLTPLERIWKSAFAPKSRFELTLVLFLAVWWSVAVGIQTSVNGIAGDGRGQYSLFYSGWACCLTSYWVLERWWVAAGLSSLKSFIRSWPNRAPGWLSILFLSLFTLIWYLDLWQNYDNLDAEKESYVREHFDSVSLGQFQWLTIVAVLTFLPAAFFVLIELLRETRPDGRNESKGSAETIMEGVCFFALALSWIPTVIIATTPGGAASLIGNAYFFTWTLVIFIFESCVWYIHDLRKELHRALKEKQDEYKQRQQEVLAKTRAIQEQCRDHDSDQGTSASGARRRMSSEFFDTDQTE